MSKKLYECHVTYSVFVLADSPPHEGSVVRMMRDAYEDPADFDAVEVTRNTLGWFPDALVYQDGPHLNDVTLAEALAMVATKS